MNAFQRGLCNTVGVLAVVLAFLGMALPVLPTVPFFLVAAACFVRGSRRPYRWLMTHPRYGRVIYQYREAKAITRSAKTVSIVILWVGILISMLLVRMWHAHLFLTLVLIGVTIYLARFREISPADLEKTRATYDAFIAREFPELSDRREP